MQGFFILKLIHVLSAIVLLGNKPVLMFALPRVRSVDEGFLCNSFLGMLEALESRVVKPSGMVLIGTGLLMTFGPFSMFDFMAPTSRFMIAGFLMWISAGFCMQRFGANAHLVKEHFTQHGSIPEAPWAFMQRMVLSAGVFDSLAVVAMVLKIPRF